VDIRRQSLQRARAQGTDEPARSLWLTEALGKEVAAGSLTIGTGDADHLQPLGRLAKETTGDQPRLTAQTGDATPHSSMAMEK
jgi:hypothetical protein